jgi:hypothetical protein
VSQAGPVAATALRARRRSIGGAYLDSWFEAKHARGQGTDGGGGGGFEAEHAGHSSHVAAGGGAHLDGTGPADKLSRLEALGRKQLMACTTALGTKRRMACTPQFT